MKWRQIETKGICYIDSLEGSSNWYWGMDYTGGDLFEAEELYHQQNSITSNRLILIKYPEGNVYEPIKAEKGQYIGKPVYYNDAIYCLLVDFINETIMIYECAENLQKISNYASITLKDVKDCYNLMLAVCPLTLIRHGYEKTFQIIWPEKVSFDIDNTESFMYRDGDKLIFSKWYEDPDYREEVVVRDCATGEILECIEGAMVEMPDGQKWILK